MPAVLSTHSLTCSLLLVFTSLAACSSSSDGAAPSGDGELTSLEGGSDDKDASSGSSPGDALKIVNLSSTVTTITGGAPKAPETGSVTFIAIVTDVHGLDAIAGGQLIDDEGGTYAPFGAGSTKGTYAATVDFATVNSVRPIEFKGAKGERSFKAKFFDNAGNEATSSLVLQLGCRDSLAGLVGACAGTCVDVDRNGSHCGKCGETCGTGQTCSAGTCKAITFFGSTGMTECLALSSMGAGTSCSSLCNVASTLGCDQYGLYSYKEDDPTCRVQPLGIGACSHIITDPFFACRCRTR